MQAAFADISIGKKSSAYYWFGYDGYLVRGLLTRLLPRLCGAFRSGRGWASFYKGQHDAAITDLEFAMRQEPSPILIGSPLGQAYARVGRDDDAIDVLEQIVVAVRAGSADIGSDAGRRAAVDGLAVLASLLDKHDRSADADQVRALAQEIQRFDIRWQDRQPRSLPSLDGEWTHWWIEADGYKLDVVPGHDPARAYRLAAENRDRMNHIVAHRAKLDPESGEYVREEHRHVITGWNPWTGKP